MRQCVALCGATPAPLSRTKQCGFVLLNLANCSAANKKWRVTDGTLLMGFATGAKAMVHERQTIKYHYVVMVCGCRRLWSFFICLFQLDAHKTIARPSAPVHSAAVRYPL
jgi:uncharacterized membrane protein YsdA (DUF1294 family)